MQGVSTRWAEGAWRRVGAGLMVLAVAGGLGGCSTRAWLVRGVADELAGQGATSEEDMGLAREAGAFYLKLSEGVLRQAPDHVALAESVSSGFTQYAYAFVASEAERLETRDVRAAQRLRERAARLYWRAQGHALTALHQRLPALRPALQAPLAAANPLTPELVGLAYWAAAAWGAAISLSTDQPERVADLPQAMRLAAWAHALAPQHGQGALAALMGQFEAARPQGSRARAAAYFDEAVVAGGGRQAAPFVAQAETLALPAGDRSGFESLLRQALQAARGQTDLGNQVMRERAQWLLDTADDRF